MKNKLKFLIKSNRYASPHKVQNTKNRLTPSLIFYYNHLLQNSSYYNKQLGLVFSSLMISHN